ncbi:hypothetical protein PsYK624_135210 [Phanerochaete sordida]|uniref:Uncharacterized protein n=1 Tax=Phanerochaete sordida TaxID=48140 RepID=A0A9P3GPR2_9APHY|nr:hypothetical protein PsYK624_135210 [Phanerochaete sordida]
MAFRQYQIKLSFGFQAGVPPLFDAPLGRFTSCLPSRSERNQWPLSVIFSHCTASWYIMYTHRPLTALSTIPHNSSLSHISIVPPAGLAYVERRERDYAANSRSRKHDVQASADTDIESLRY